VLERGCIFLKSRRKKNAAKFRAELHKFYDGDFSGADQTGRAFRWSAHLHKKAGFLRAGEAGE